MLVSLYGDLVMQVIATEGLRGLLYVFEEKLMDAIFKIGAGGPWYQTAPAKSVVGKVL